MKLNFIPSYSYKVKTISVLLLSIILLWTLFSIIFKKSFISIEINEWFIALSLLFISLSKDKIYSKESILIKYYAGKITFSYIICFILSMKLAGFIGDFKLLIDNIILVIIALTFYQICFNIIKISVKAMKLELEEESIYLKPSSKNKLYFISFILSVITIIIIIAIK